MLARVYERRLADMLIVIIILLFWFLPWWLALICTVLILMGANS